MLIMLPPYQEVVSGSSLSYTTGLLSWLKADSLSLADGANVTSWADDSGNSNNATNAASNRPIYKTNIQNSLPVVRFASPQYLDLPNFLSGVVTSATIFIVVKCAYDPNPVENTTSLWKFGSDSSQTHFPYVNNIIYDNFGTTVRKTTVDPTTPMNQFNVYCVTTAASSWINYLNNTQLYSTSSNTVGWTTTPKIGYAGFGFEGDIGEILIYNAVLNSTNRGTVFSYLKAKWNTP